MPPAVDPRPPLGTPEQRMVARVRARREEFQRRGRLYRGAFVLVGFVLLLGGVAMLVLPGPAFVVIPIGLAILSLQFDWAEALLERSLAEAERARHRAAQTTRRQRVLSAVAVACGAAAFLAVAILYDIPLVPYV